MSLARPRQLTAEEVRWPQPSQGLLAGHLVGQARLGQLRAEVEQVGADLIANLEPLLAGEVQRGRQGVEIGVERGVQGRASGREVRRHQPAPSSATRLTPPANVAQSRSALSRAVSPRCVNR